MFTGKRIAAIFLSIFLVVGLMTGYGNSSKTKNTGTDSIKPDSNVPDYLNATGYPIIKKPLTLKFSNAQAVNQVPFEEMYCFKEFEKKSGIHIEWDNLTSGVAEKRGLMIASNELPDAFYRHNIPVKEVLQYGLQGTFIPMEGLIDKYGVNLKAAFIRQPEVKRALTSPDGKIYTLSAIYGYNAPMLNNFLWMNTKWLENVGMKMPTTTDEFYNVLKAFKEKDPNGNGKADEVPFGGSSDRVLDTLIRGSFGLGTNGGGDYQVGTDGKVLYINTDPRYRETLEYLNKLYTAGLIDKDIFTTSNANGKKKCATGVIGTIYNNNPEVATVPDKEAWEGLPMLKGPRGDQVYSHAVSAITEMGSFVITSASKYPEAVMRWVDFWYGDEGTELLHGGEKGVTYIMNAQGNMEYTDFVNKNPDGLTVAQVTGKYIPIPSVPRILIEKYNSQPFNAPNAKLARSKVAPYAPKDIWPAFMYTAEELDIMNTTGNDITQYYNEMNIKFITGAAPLSSWDDYVKQIKSLGLEKVLAVQQAAYDRYNKAK